jgi:cytochrome c oxidase subunit I+III
VFSGVLAILSVLRWLWETDRPIKMREADVGAGIVLPIAITGPRSHGWWALNTLMVVIGMIGVMAVFAYLYLYGIHPEVWSPPPPLWQTALIVALNVLVLALSWGGRKWLEKRAGQYANDGPWVLEMIGAAVLAGSLYIDIDGWLSTGLQPTATGMGATVFMLMALQGQVVAVSVIMAIYLAFREARGLLTSQRDDGRRRPVHCLFRAPGHRLRPGAAAVSGRLRWSRARSTRTGPGARCSSRS